MSDNYQARPRCPHGEYAEQCAACRTGSELPAPVGSVREVILSSKIRWGSDLPVQLEIQDGEIVFVGSNTRAKFSALPNGTKINVLPHDELIKKLDNAMMWTLSGW